MVQVLLHSLEVVSEKYLNFVKESFLEGEKTIFEPISKSNIKTSNERKNVGKILTVMKEDKQAFGAITAKPTDLHEAFSYTIRSLNFLIPVYINLTKLALEIVL